MIETLDGTRYSWYCPPDPGWADRETVGKVRSALKRIDPKLSVWWCPEWKPNDSNQPGRWGIVYYMARAQRWSPVFYWETVAGDFLPLSTECIERILKMLEQMDTTKIGDVYTIDKAAKFMQERNEKKRSAELRDVLMQHMRDYGRRLAGVDKGGIIQVGAGKSSRGGLGADTDFDAFVAERGLK